MSRNGKANGNNHSLEQGLRLHHLANLGGLVAIAGLDQEPPDLLLGVLLSVAHEVAALTAAQRAHVSSMGHAKLDDVRVCLHRHQLGDDPARRNCSS